MEAIMEWLKVNWQGGALAGIAVLVVTNWSWIKGWFSKAKEIEPKLATGLQEFKDKISAANGDPVKLFEAVLLLHQAFEASGAEEALRALIDKALPAIIDAAKVAHQKGPVQ